MVPTLHAVPAEAPARRMITRHPLAGAVTSGAAFAVLLLSATYPVATAEASSATGAGQGSGSNTTAMAGMAMGGSTSGHGHSAPTGSAFGHSAKARETLSMPGMGGATDTNWHYTGPALPAQEQSVLTTVYAETEKGHAMQSPSCTTMPTGTQLEDAMHLVQTTSAAVAKYANLSAAKADGYVAITNPSYPVVHYLNIRYLNQQDVLDPNAVQSLVYATTPGGPVLVAAMYLMPSQGEKGPMPGGCLTQWHAHTNLCQGGPTGTISGFQSDGMCPNGEAPLQTPEMMHVWQVPVPGGPLAMDPTDQQIVEAAIMAQQDGQAPTTPGTNAPTGAGSFGT
jgi:hypothetical protein